ncbi:MAG: transposase [Prevotellaceae bacterium]|jgi:hypothetical protein|nr:transposase [Prevotellaceae bacterium]
MCKLKQSAHCSWVNEEGKSHSCRWELVAEGTRIGVVGFFGNIGERLSIDETSLRKIVCSCFPKAIRVIDRFHVLKLVYDTLQAMRIAHRWDAINEETDAMEEVKLSKKNIPHTLENRDSYFRDDPSGDIFLFPENQ